MTTDNTRRMLAPVAYREAALPSLRLARSSRLARTLGACLLVFLAVATLLVAVAPWQQSVKGSGNVIAYAPLERQQVIESPIKGRIVRLGDGVFENALIKKGQLIAELADIDPGYLARLQAQLAASQRKWEATRASREAARRQLEAAVTTVASFESQVTAYELIRQQLLAAADATVESARHQREAAEQQLAETQAALAQVEADFQRQSTLYSEGLASQLKFQEAERKLKEAIAKTEQAAAYVRVAENDLVVKERERDGKAQEAQVKIDAATASLLKAQGDVAKAESDVAKITSDLAEVEKELMVNETALARQQNQFVLAPFDGFVTRISANQGSQLLNEGDPICVIVPDTTDRAVQIWVDGNDAPLIEPGRHVRLQFEGWPAVQFAGWPAAAVGTFGGEVVSVDATDDGFGRFRVLVLPDLSTHPWPSQRFLRQGVRANGWILLNQVPLWYEIWRNMNGFPPVVSMDEPKGKPSLKLPKP